eukprot:TRINITY_DN6405_c0_g1_i1.p1 TRINITY_DN6405_c0_g1~~TRINITY_DN6405_c0_g1_i1.p1  ORF type:complete len:1771 (+),score=531.96 TRINITY_DN6405_c0_g1_i1:32-5314(+)
MAAATHTDRGAVRRSGSMTEFKDLARPLLLNRESSFAHDEGIRNSLSSRSKSFITAQDATPQQSPAIHPLARTRVAHSTSSLGESVIMELAGTGEEDVWLGPQYIRMASYEALLLSRPQLLPHLAGRGPLPADVEQPEVGRIADLRERLGVTDAEHHQIVGALDRVVAKHGRSCPANSALLRLHLVADAVAQQLEHPDSCEPSADALAQPGPELRHLSVFTSAMHLFLGRAQGGADAQDSVAQQQSRLASDCRAVSQAILQFRRTQSSEAADAACDLIAGMVKQYSRHPQVRAPQGNPGRASAGGESSSSGRGSPTAAAFGAVVGASADDLVLTADGPEGAAVLPMTGSTDRAQTARTLQLLSVSGEQEEPGRSPAGFQPVEKRWNRAPRPISGASMRPTSVNTSGLESQSPLGKAAGTGQEELLSLNGTPHTPEPQPEQPAVVPYVYPLNVMLYSALLRTFFVETADESRQPPPAASSTAGGGQKRGHLHGVQKSRRQEARMAVVVDVLAPVREFLAVSSFMHAACFVHVVYTESLEAQLDIAEMFRILSVDCYFYPGFGAFCTTPGLEGDEEACRQQVLRNVRSDFMPKLADYHWEFLHDPEDLIFCAKLYTVALEAHQKDTAEPPVTWIGAGDADLAAKQSCQPKGRGSGTEERASASSSADSSAVPPGSNPRRQLRFAEDVSSKRKGSAAARPASAPTSVREPPSGDESEDRASTTHGKGLQRAVMYLGNLFGPDVAAMVQNVMLQGGIEEASACDLSLDTYAEMMALIISSCHKHYIRIKHKVATRGGRDDPVSGWEVWLAQITSAQPLRRPRRPSESVGASCSALSTVALAGEMERTGAERLLGNARDETAPKPSARPTLSHINGQLKLNLDQIWRLVEVLLLELHADTRHYCPSLVSVVPSAATVVLDTYAQLLSNDVLQSLDALTILPSGQSRDGVVDSTGVRAQLSPEHRPGPRSPDAPLCTPDQRQALAAQGAGQCTGSPGCATAHTDAGQESVANGTRVVRSPLLPRRSSTPPLLSTLHQRDVGCTVPAREVRTTVAADDDIGTSLLNTNLVYTALIVMLLQENLRTYIGYSRHSRADFSLLTQQQLPGARAGERDSAYWLAGVPVAAAVDEGHARQQPEGRWGGFTCIGDSTDGRRQAPPQKASSLRLLRRRLSTHDRGDAAAAAARPDAVPPHTAPPRRQQSGARSPRQRASSVAGSNSPEFPHVTGGWDSKFPSQRGGESSPGVQDSIDATLQAVVERVVGRWRCVADATLDDSVERALAVDAWEPVGTLRDQIISSSAVDVSLVANRVAQLVEHGVENAWSTLKATKATMHVHALDADASTDRGLCERFTSTCELCMSYFEEQCKQLLSETHRKYVSALVAPLAPLRLDSDVVAAPIDPRQLRHRHRQLFELKSSSLACMAVRANDLLFTRSRFEDMYYRVVSGFALVAWRRLQAEPPAPEKPQAHVAEAGKPTLVLSQALLEQSRGFSPQSPAARTGPGNALGPLNAAFADDAVNQVLMFVATKVVVFDGVENLQLLYTTADRGIDSVLEPLGATLHEVTGSLLPALRKPFLRYVLGTLAHSVTTKLVRGKMARPSKSRFTFFQQLIDDLHTLREFFLSRQADGVPQMLAESEVESMTACVLSAILLLLSRNPTDVILQQAAEEALPHHLTYTKAQIHGMVEQIAGRSPTTHQFLLEALEVQRTNELQHSWDEQRAGLLTEPPVEAHDGSEVEEKVAEGAAKTERRGRGAEKKQGPKSRLCCVQ